MPQYEYACRSCGAEYEATQSITDDAYTICPGCDRADLRRVLFPPTVLDATPRTLGTLAERNGAGAPYWLEAQRRKAEEDRRRGIEEINKGLPAGMQSARPAKPETPFWRGEKVNGDLNKLTPKQKHNYVMTGDSRG